MIIVYSPSTQLESRDTSGPTSTPPSSSSLRLLVSFLVPSASAAPSTYSPPSLSLLCCPGAVTCLKTPKVTLQCNLTACCVCVCVCLSLRQRLLLVCTVRHITTQLPLSKHQAGWFLFSHHFWSCGNKFSLTEKKNSVHFCPGWARTEARAHSMYRTFCN